MYDALLVAAVVEFCDRVERRPAYTRSRDFRVRIPVHSSAIWNRNDVKESLIEALTFLMGDTWSFEFIQRQKVAEKPLQHNMPLPSGLEAVIPFSDGLDSRSGWQTHRAAARKGADTCEDRYWELGSSYSRKTAVALHVNTIQSPNLGFGIRGVVGAFARLQVHAHQWSCLIPVEGSQSHHD